MCRGVFCINTDSPCNVLNTSYHCYQGQRFPLALGLFKTKQEIIAGLYGSWSLYVALCRVVQLLSNQLIGHCSVGSGCVPPKKKWTLLQLYSAGLLFFSFCNPLWSALQQPNQTTHLKMNLRTCVFAASLIWSEWGCSRHCNRVNTWVPHMALV